MRSDALMAALVALSAATAGGAEDSRPWRVPGAALRLRLRAVEKPSPAEAGYIVEIPGGTAMPGPHLATRVFDGEGRAVPSGVLWHDPGRGLALVYGESGSPVVDLYLERAPRTSAWTPASGLAPGSIVFAAPCNTGVAGARAIADAFPPGPGVFFERTPVAASGARPEGLPGPLADCVLGHIILRDPGRTWIAPETTGGAQIMARIDGREIEPRKEFPQRSGGLGAWMDLAPGIHRVELLVFRPEEGARACLTVKTPNATRDELGGENPALAGMTMWAARPLREDECARSGSARVENCAVRDGTPAALFTAEPRMYFRFGDRPVLLYELAALTQDFPPGTRCDWLIDDSGAVTNRPRLRWLFDGLADHRVRLTVSAGGRRGTDERTFHAFCSGRQAGNITGDSTADTCRQVLLEMLCATPLEKDPARGWSPAMWDLFARVADPVRGRALLVHVFTKRWHALRGAVEPARRWPLEDLFFESLCALEPGKAGEWVEAVGRVETDAARKLHWQLRLAESDLYYRADPAGARRRLAALERTAAGRRASLRLADADFLEGRVAEAVARYGALQQGSAAGAGRDWRAQAVRLTAASENARKLVADGYFLEARAALDAWEDEFPLSKVSGDFMIVEARLYARIGAYRRARRLLEAYCRGVEMTSYLAEAMRDALTCMMNDKAGDDALREFCAQMKKRFAFHPAGRDAEVMLQMLRRDQPARDPTPDRF